MPSAKQGSYRYHFFKVFRYDSTRGMNSRSTDCEGDALTTRPNASDLLETFSVFYCLILQNVWWLQVQYQNRCIQSRSTPTSGPPKVSARAPAHRSYHFRGVKLKSCIKKIHHNLYISKQANGRIKHADTEGASHKKFGTDARVQ